MKSVNLHVERSVRESASTYVRNFSKYYINSNAIPTSESIIYWFIWECIHEDVNEIRSNHEIS